MLDQIPRSKLHEALPLDPIVHAYACVALSERPESPAMVWRAEGGQIEGALIDREWSSYQLVATSRAALHELLNCLPEAGGVGWRLSFPEWAMRDVAARYPGSEHSYEVLHLCTREHYQAPRRGDADVVRLTPQLVEEFAFDLEIVKALSGISAQQCRRPLYGALCDRQLVCIADGSAMTAQVAIVQQVYTVPHYRRQGLARAVVARLSEEILALGRVGVYCADYFNHASLALCRSLGYKPIAVFGWAEYEPG
jgi:GNAT superfamily N-acetyltransferase